MFDVLSKSTRDANLTQKLPNDQATPSIQVVMVWRRTEEGWIEDEVARPDAALDLDVIGVSLTFPEIYEGVGFG